MSSDKPAEKASIELYRDAGRPAAQGFGQAIKPVGAELGETLARTVHLVLAPVKGLVWGYEQLEELFLLPLAKKLEDRKERLVAPAPNVAGPTFEALRYAGSEESLREMYINLLATAMDAETADNAHPAFAEIIKQMTPQEAMIVREFASKDASVVIDVAAVYPAIGRKTLRLFRESLVVLKHGDTFRHLLQIPAYIDNIVRLQIATIHDVGNVNEYSQTISLGGYPEFDRILSETGHSASLTYLKDFGKIRNPTVGTIFEVTTFGRQFIRACVSSD